MADLDAFVTGLLARAEAAARSEALAVIAEGPEALHAIDAQPAEARKTAQGNLGACQHSQSAQTRYRQDEHSSEVPGLPQI